MPPTMPKTRDPAQNAIRRRVKQILDDTGRTQTALGKAVRRDKHWASRWLTGATDATYGQLQAVARFLEVSLGDLEQVPPAQPSTDDRAMNRETWVLATYRELSPDSQERLRQFLGDLHHDEQHAPAPRKRAQQA